MQMQMSLDQAKAQLADMHAAIDLQKRMHAAQERAMEAAVRLATAEGDYHTAMLNAQLSPVDDAEELNDRRTSAVVQLGVYRDALMENALASNALRILELEHARRMLVVQERAAQELAEGIEKAEALVQPPGGFALHNRTAPRQRK